MIGPARNLSLADARESGCQIIEVDVEVTQDLVGCRLHFSETAIESGNQVLWDWGDGTVQTVTVVTHLEHIYSSTGKYTIRIVGKVTEIFGGEDATQYPWVRFLDQWLTNSAVKRISLPSDFGIIGPYAFAGMHGVKLELDRVKAFSEYAFLNTRAGSGLFGMIVREASVADHAFDTFESLKNVVFVGTRTLAMNLFDNCSNLEQVTWDHNNIAVGYRIFKNCNHLKRVILKNDYKPGYTVQITISPEAFRECDSVVEIDIPKTKSVTQGMNGYPFYLKTGSVFHCTDGDLVVT